MLWITASSVLYRCSPSLYQKLNEISTTCLERKSQHFVTSRTFFPTLSQEPPWVPAGVAPGICVTAAVSHSGDRGSPTSTHILCLSLSKGFGTPSVHEHLPQPWAAKNHPRLGPGALRAARAGSACSPFVVGFLIYCVVIAQNPRVWIWSGAAAELHDPLSTDGTGGGRGQGKLS